MEEVKYPGAREALMDSLPQQTPPYDLRVELISPVSLVIGGCPEKNLSSILNIT